MLVLSRKLLQAVVIGGPDGHEGILKLTVLEIKKGCVRLGFDAPPEIPVDRWEIWNQLEEFNLRDQPSDVSFRPF